MVIRTDDGIKEGEEKNCKTTEYILKTTAGTNEKNTVNLGQEALFIENKIARKSKTSLVEVRWLTTSEAAEYLRVSISAIKTMMYRGQVRVHKLGKRNRFLREELERLITLPVFKQEG